MFELRNRRARKLGLENIELFSRCTERQLRKITVLMTDLRVPAGQILARTGEPGEEYFVIVAGSARVVRQGATVDILGPGSHYGDVSLLDGGPRIDTVVADTDMELLVLSRGEFSSDDFLVPSVARKILAELAARLRRTQEAQCQLSQGVDVRLSAEAEGAGSSIEDRLGIQMEGELSAAIGA
jgi:CRP/FNR family cyclic AMP-dependent transcriptional regulator